MKSYLFLVATALLLTLSVATTKDFRESRKQRVQAILSKHGATNCYRSWIGDKTCDQACNNKEHSFDGGDCLPRFQQMHSTLKTEAFQSSFDVQVKGYTTTQSTRVEHHVYDIPYTTVRRLQKFTLEPVGHTGRADIVEMRISTRYESCRLRVRRNSHGHLVVDPIPVNVAVGINDVVFVTSQDTRNLMGAK